MKTLKESEISNDIFLAGWVLYKVINNDYYDRIRHNITENDINDILYDFCVEKPKKPYTTYFIDKVEKIMLDVEEVKK